MEAEGEALAGALGGPLGKARGLLGEDDLGAEVAGHECAPGRVEQVHAQVGGPEGDLLAVQRIAATCDGIAALGHGATRGREGSREQLGVLAGATPGDVRRVLPRLGRRRRVRGGGTGRPGLNVGLNVGLHLVGLAQVVLARRVVLVPVPVVGLDRARRLIGVGQRGGVLEPEGGHDGDRRNEDRAQSRGDQQPQLLGSVRRLHECTNDPAWPRSPVTTKAEESFGQDDCVHLCQ